MEKGRSIKGFRYQMLRQEKGGIAQDLRSDGRKRLTYLPISIETGNIPQANGSVRVKIGATDVIASVKGRRKNTLKFIVGRKVKVHEH